MYLFGGFMLEPGKVHPPMQSVHSTVDENKASAGKKGSVQAKGFKFSLPTTFSGSLKMTVSMIKSLVTKLLTRSANPINTSTISLEATEMDHTPGNFESWRDQLGFGTQENPGFASIGKNFLLANLQGQRNITNGTQELPEHKKLNDEEFLANFQLLQGIFDGENTQFNQMIESRLPNFINDVKAEVNVHKREIIQELQESGVEIKSDASLSDILTKVHEKNPQHDSTLWKLAENCLEFEIIVLKHEGKEGQINELKDSLLERQVYDHPNRLARLTGDPPIKQFFVTIQSQKGPYDLEYNTRVSKLLLTNKYVFDRELQKTTFSDEVKGNIRASFFPQSPQANAPLTKELFSAILREAKTLDDIRFVSEILKKCDFFDTIKISVFNEKIAAKMNLHKSSSVQRDDIQGTLADLNKHYLPVELREITNTLMMLVDNGHFPKKPSVPGVKVPDAMTPGTFLQTWNQHVDSPEKFLNALLNLAKPNGNVMLGPLPITKAIQLIGLLDKWIEQNPEQAMQYKPLIDTVVDAFHERSQQRWPGSVTRGLGGPEALATLEKLRRTNQTSS